MRKLIQGLIAGMQTKEIEDLVKTLIKADKIEASGDGYHFQLLVVANDFINKTKLERQQLVYQALQQKISSGELHAISMQTYTVEEFQQRARS